MWVTKTEYLNLRTERDTAVGTVKALEAQLSHQHAAFEWLKVLTNQYAHERAQLMSRYLGVDVEVPKVEAAPVKQDIPTVLGSHPFDDAGDDLARKLGMGWNERGELVHNLPTE